MNRPLVAGLVGVLMIGVSSAAIAQDRNAESAPALARVTGAYELASVNGKTVPAPAWKRASADTTCTTVANAGSFLFDSYGRWAAMTTERDRCFTQAGARDIKPDVATLAAGRYTVRGDTLELTDEWHPGTTIMGTLAGKTLTLDFPGIAESSGQKAKYTLRQVRLLRP